MPYDFENILSASHDTERIVIAEGDLVKLERFTQSGIFIYAIKLAVSMAARDDARLFDLVADKIQSSGRIVKRPK